MPGIPLFRSKDAHLFTILGDTHLRSGFAARLTTRREAGFAAATKDHPLLGKMYRAEAMIFWIAMAVLAIATVEFAIHFVQFIRD